MPISATTSMAASIIVIRTAMAGIIIAAVHTGIIMEAAMLMEAVM